MQSYLTSHYCRKLHKLSLLEIKNQKKKSNSIVERVVKSRAFVNSKLDNLLQKRPLEEFLEEDLNSDESQDTSRLDDGKWRTSGFTIDFYDSSKSFEDNFMQLMITDASVRSEGFLIKEIRYFK